MGVEENYIKSIENGIRGIRLGTKKPSEVNVGANLEKLEKTNKGMYEELLTKYSNVMLDYNKRK
jgi:hypothetical protein